MSFTAHRLYGPKGIGALSLPDSVIRSSVRFGLGRSTTKEQLYQAVDTLTAAAQQIRTMLPLAFQINPQDPTHGNVGHLGQMKQIRNGWFGNPGYLCYAFLRKDRHIPQDGRVGSNALCR